MVKKAMAILFFMLYLVFLFLPGLPLLNYYFSSVENQNVSLTQNLHLDNNDVSPVGDGVFLRALVKRVQGDDVSKKAQNPPPRTNIETNTLIYMPVGFLQNYTHLSGISIHFACYSEKIIIRYSTVLLPPPNFA